MDLAVDITIASGESLALFGPSGAGKTSLLRMLAGLMRPDSGRIVVAGETWFDSQAGIDLPPQRRRAGLVFQDYALFPNMSVRGNLEYALKNGTDRARVDEILENVGLTGLSGRSPETLSGGQKQRVALARALVSRPGILLLDEPLSALDQSMRTQLQETIASLSERYRLAMVLVSHDHAEILRLARRVVRLESGRVVGEGKPDEVFGTARNGNGLRLPGVVVSIEVTDVVRVVSVLAGGQLVRVSALPQAAEGMRPGDRVLLALEDFSPSLLRLDGDGAPIS